MLYMFGVELQKRLRAVGSSTDIFSAHPGVAQTDAFRKSDKSKAMARIMASGADLIGQSSGGGAQSLVRCATDPALTGQYPSASSHMLWCDLHALLASQHGLQFPYLSICVWMHALWRLVLNQIAIDCCYHMCLHAEKVRPASACNIYMCVRRYGRRRQTLGQLVYWHSFPTIWLNMATMFYP